MEGAGAAPRESSLELGQGGLLTFRAPSGTLSRQGQKDQGRKGVSCAWHPAVRGLQRGLGL